ncbi:hypothetical protein C8F01DRAFT_1241909 [Mycena amicta]|nr:hypothetical protein C8F01DRAFT_1241909 [Mycena amicta]
MSLQYCACADQGTSNSWPHRAHEAARVLLSHLLRPQRHLTSPPVLVLFALPSPRPELQPLSPATGLDWVRVFAPFLAEYTTQEELELGTQKVARIFGAPHWHFGRSVDGEDDTEDSALQHIAGGRRSRGLRAAVTHHRYPLVARP